MKTQKCGLSILHLPWHRRKVCGTVSEAGGKQMVNVRVTLEKKNTYTLDREDTVETYTGEDGRYCFNGLKKGSYRLHIYDREEIKILAAHIDMGEGEEENIFTILQAGCCNEKTKQEGNKYITDVAI